jgi:superfamily II DNA or RNA helicase
VGGDFDQQELAQALDHDALNMAAAMYYQHMFGNKPGIVYSAGVDHAERVAAAMRAVGLKAAAVSGRTPPRQLANTLAAYERGEINVLVNAQLLAEGWNAPRATVCMHLAPTASRRVYQQRIGRIMRLHRRKEAGVVVDFIEATAPHTDRTVTVHSLLGVDVYHPGALVTPRSPRRRQRWRRSSGARSSCATGSRSRSTGCRSTSRGCGRRTRAAASARRTSRSSRRCSRRCPTRRGCCSSPPARPRTSTVSCA